MSSTRASGPPSRSSAATPASPSTASTASAATTPTTPSRWVTTRTGSRRSSSSRIPTTSTPPASSPIRPKAGTCTTRSSSPSPSARAATNIAVADAPACVYGYAVSLDMTRRDLQAEAKKLARPWEVAKAFERSAPIGPIVPAAEAGRLDRGPVTLAVNGAVRQAGDLDQMIWKVPEMIAHLSRFFVLAPGDVILTGTPAGVGAVVPRRRDGGEDHHPPAPRRHRRLSSRRPVRRCGSTSPSPTSSPFTRAATAPPRCPAGRARPRRSGSPPTRSSPAARRSSTTPISRPPTDRRCGRPSRPAASAASPCCSATGTPTMSPATPPSPTARSSPIR